MNCDKTQVLLFNYDTLHPLETPETKKGLRVSTADSGAQYLASSQSQPNLLQGVFSRKETLGTIKKKIEPLRRNLQYRSLQKLIATV